MEFDFLSGEVILIDKPLEWTSFDVVNFLRFFIRKVYGIKKLKVGHAGTLDPLATGLLIICTGKKTKEIVHYQGMVKTYTGSMQLGGTTPSYDRETTPDQHFEYGHLTIDDLEKARQRFLGEIDQTPPLYSAVKIKGKRAFDYARENKPVELKKRKVIIHEFQLTNINLPHVDFMVRCSKGTYIRSLVNDFGKALENGAFLSGLRRTQIGAFNVSEAFTIEKFRSLILAQNGISDN
ncbi:MAG TPA: tRNA pseudouridine(55) synthase TruB [Bacteroidetes bacterium]|nr:tRNA pseudouridine(55) synthase TruB [Bacteroidota bacterium]